MLIQTQVLTLLVLLAVTSRSFSWDRATRLSLRPINAINNTRPLTTLQPFKSYVPTSKPSAAFGTILTRTSDTSKDKPTRQGFWSDATKRPTKKNVFNSRFRESTSSSNTTANNNEISTTPIPSVIQESKVGGQRLNTPLVDTETPEQSPASIKTQENENNATMKQPVIRRKKFHKPNARTLPPAFASKKKPGTSEKLFSDNSSLETGSIAELAAPNFYSKVRNNSTDWRNRSRFRLSRHSTTSAPSPDIEDDNVEEQPKTTFKFRKVPTTRFVMASSSRNKGKENASIGNNQNASKVQNIPTTAFKEIKAKKSSNEPGNNNFKFGRLTTKSSFPSTTVRRRHDKLNIESISSDLKFVTHASSVEDDLIFEEFVTEGPPEVSTPPLRKNISRLSVRRKSKRRRSTTPKPTAQTYEDEIQEDSIESQRAQDTISTSTNHLSMSTETITTFPETIETEEPYELAIKPTPFLDISRELSNENSKRVKNATKAFEIRFNPLVRSDTTTEKPDPTTQITLRDTTKNTNATAAKEPINLVPNTEMHVGRSKEAVKDYSLVHHDLHRISKMTTTMQQIDKNLLNEQSFKDNHLSKTTATNSKSINPFNSFLTTISPQKANQGSSAAYAIWNFHQGNKSNGWFYESKNGQARWTVHSNNSSYTVGSTEVSPDDSPSNSLTIKNLKDSYTIGSGEDHGQSKVSPLNPTTIRKLKSNYAGPRTDDQTKNSSLNPLNLKDSYSIDSINRSKDHPLNLKDSYSIDSINQSKDHPLNLKDSYSIDSINQSKDHPLNLKDSYSIDSINQFKDHPLKPSGNLKYSYIVDSREDPTKNYPLNPLTIEKVKDSYTVRDREDMDLQLNPLANGNFDHEKANLRSNEWTPLPNHQLNAQAQLTSANYKHFDEVQNVQFAAKRHELPSNVGKKSRNKKKTKNNRNRQRIKKNKISILDNSQITLNIKNTSTTTLMNKDKQQYSLKNQNGIGTTEVMKNRQIHPDSEQNQTHPSEYLDSRGEGIITINQELEVNNNNFRVPENYDNKSSHYAKNNTAANYEMILPPAKIVSNIQASNGNSQIPTMAREQNEGESNLSGASQFLQNNNVKLILNSSSNDTDGTLPREWQVVGDGGGGGGDGDGWALLGENGEIEWKIKFINGRWQVVDVETSEVKNIPTIPYNKYVATSKTNAEDSVKDRIKPSKNIGDISNNNYANESPNLLYLINNNVLIAPEIETRQKQHIESNIQPNNNSNRHDTKNVVPYYEQQDSHHSSNTNPQIIFVDEADLGKIFNSDFQSEERLDNVGKDVYKSFEKDGTVENNPNYPIELQSRGLGQHPTKVTLKQIVMEPLAYGNTEEDAVDIFKSLAEQSGSIKVWSNGKVQATYPNLLQKQFPSSRGQGKGYNQFQNPNRRESAPQRGLNYQNGLQTAYASHNYNNNTNSVKSFRKNNPVSVNINSNRKDFIVNSHIAVKSQNLHQNKNGHNRYIEYPYRQVPSEFADEGPDQRSKWRQVERPRWKISRHNLNIEKQNDPETNLHFLPYANPSSFQRNLRYNTPEQNHHKVKQRLSSNFNGVITGQISPSHRSPSPITNRIKTHQHQSFLQSPMIGPAKTSNSRNGINHQYDFEVNPHVIKVPRRDLKIGKNKQIIVIDFSNKVKMSGKKDLEIVIKNIENKNLPDLKNR